MFRQKQIENNVSRNDSIEKNNELDDSKILIIDNPIVPSLEAVIFEQLYVDTLLIECFNKKLDLNSFVGCGIELYTKIVENCRDVHEVLPDDIRHRIISAL